MSSGPPAAQQITLNLRFELWQFETQNTQYLYYLCYTYNVFQSHPLWAAWGNSQGFKERIDKLTVKMTPGSHSAATSSSSLGNFRGFKRSHCAWCGLIWSSESGKGSNWFRQRKWKCYFFAKNSSKRPLLVEGVCAINERRARKKKHNLMIIIIKSTLASRLCELVSAIPL